MDPISREELLFARLDQRVRTAAFALAGVMVEAIVTRQGRARGARLDVCAACHAAVRRVVKEAALVQLGWHSQHAKS